MRRPKIENFDPQYERWLAHQEGREYDGIDPCTGKLAEERYTCPDPMAGCRIVGPEKPWYDGAAIPIGLIFFVVILFAALL